MTTALEQQELDELQFIKRKKLFEDLVIHPAWLELLGIAQVQRKFRYDRLTEPPDENKDGTMRTHVSEFTKGVLYGIDLLLTTPHATIEQAKEIIQDRNLRQQTKDVNNDNGSRNAKPADSDDNGNLLPDGATVTDLSGDNS